VFTVATQPPRATIEIDPRSATTRRSTRGASIAAVVVVWLCGDDARRVVPPHAVSRATSAMQHDVATGRTHFQE
jgi:hypothetical protein